MKSPDQPRRASPKESKKPARIHWRASFFFFSTTVAAIFFLALTLRGELKKTA